MIIGSRQKMNATENDIIIKIRDREISRAEVVKSLVVHIDRHLSWAVHIFIRFQKRFLPLLARLNVPDRPFMTCKTAVQVYSALIYSLTLTTTARSGTNWETQLP